MRYAKIRNMDVVNGIGISCSIFFQGCHFHCKNCFNQSTWDFDGGFELTDDVKDKFISSCKVDYVDSIGILGGEPTDQDEYELLEFLYELKLETNKKIFMWTGNLFQNISDKEYLRWVDVLIDGQFIEELKDLNLKLRGSTNQRVIDVQQSLLKGKVVTYDERGSN